MLGAINFFLCVPIMVPRKWVKGIVCVLAFIFKNTTIKYVHIHCRKCFYMQKITEKIIRFIYNPSIQK